MKISRRTFSAGLVAGAATSLASTRSVAAASTPTKARNERRTRARITRPIVSGWRTHSVAHWEVRQHRKLH
jgi:hypothetical protein